MFDIGFFMEKEELRQQPCKKRNDVLQVPLICGEPKQDAPLWQLACLGPFRTWRWRWRYHHTPLTKEDEDLYTSRVVIV